MSGSVTSVKQHYVSHSFAPRIHVREFKDRQLAAFDLRLVPRKPIFELIDAHQLIDLQMDTFCDCILPHELSSWHPVGGYPELALADTMGALLQQKR